MVTLDPGEGSALPRPGYFALKQLYGQVSSDSLLIRLEKLLWI